MIPRWLYELDDAIRDLSWRCWPWIAVAALLTSAMWWGLTLTAR